jgi:hypothetical protein
VSGTGSRAFFEPDGETRYRATALTRGPWHPDLQHGGPSAALLGRSFHRRAADLGMQVARVCVEFFRPIPIDTFALREEVLRPGKKLALLGASLARGDEETVRATALCLRVTDLALPATAAAPLTLPPPDACPPYRLPFFVTDEGYHTAMELRPAAGRFGSGAMAAWMRMRVPLVDGETPSPLERVLVAADSGNGISLVLDVARWTFVNPDLTVHLHRMPAGEWVALDALTLPEPNGIGLATSTISDERGPIGRGAQSLIIQQR